MIIATFQEEFLALINSKHRLRCTLPLANALHLMMRGRCNVAAHYRYGTNCDKTKADRLQQHIQLWVSRILALRVSTFVQRKTSGYLLIALPELKAKTNLDKAAVTTQLMRRSLPPAQRGCSEESGFSLAVAYSEQCLQFVRQRLAGGKS